MALSAASALTIMSVVGNALKWAAGSDSLQKSLFNSADDCKSLVINLCSEEIEDRLENDADSHARLRNRHLDQLVAEAVFALMREHARATPAHRKPLLKLTKAWRGRHDAWRKHPKFVAAFQQIGPEKLFEWMKAGFAGTTALDVPTWQALLETAVRLAGMDEPPLRPVLPPLATLLYTRLPHAVRELLKEDRGEKAFIGLQLLSLGRLLAGVAQTNLALGEIAGGLDVLRNDIERLRKALPDGAEGRALILAESDKALAILVRLEQKVDCLQTGQDHLTAKVDLVLQTADEIKAAVQARPMAPAEPEPEPPLSEPLPAGAEDLFVPRIKELNQLKKALAEPGVAYVVGMPGVGKSYLVERFFALAGTPLRRAAWIALEPRHWETPAKLLAALQQALTVQLQAPNFAVAAAQLADPRAAVVVENADDDRALNPLQAFFRSLPASLRGIVTGRHDLPGNHPWTAVEVHPYDTPQEGAKQLRKELGAKKAKDFAAADLETLSTELGHLPLALHLAAGYLDAGFTATQFLAEFRAQKQALQAMNPADPRVANDPARAAVAPSFGISLKVFERRAQEAGEPGWPAAFAALAYLPLTGFGPSLAAGVAGLDDTAALKALAVARQVRLIQSDAGRWRFHPLLAEFLQPKADAGWQERRSKWFMERLPEKRAVDPERQELNAETDALVQWLGAVPLQDRARTLRFGDQYAIQTGPYLAWRVFCQEAVDGGASLDDLHKLLFVMSQVGLSSGDPALAESSARQLIEVERQRQQPREEAVAWGCVADILEARGQLDEALRIRREEQLPVYERLGDVRSKAVTMGKIADILQARGQLDEALRIRREEQLPVYERLGDVRSKAVTMGKIADILQARGQLDEALRILREEELPVYERLGDVRSKAVTMGKIADILQARGQLDEALRIRREEQLPVYERLGDVRSKAVTMGKIADILQARGQLDEALRILRDEVAPVFERLGDVRSKAVTMGKIADILEARGQLDEALRILREEELPVYERLGDVRSKAVTMGKIADILQARGQLDEALRIRREEQLPVYERLGDVRSKAVTMGKIADILQARGQLDEALRIRREEELPVYERLGDVRGLLVCRTMMAQYLLLLKRPGDREEAAALLREALAAAEKMKIPEAEQIRAIQRQHGLA